MLIKVKVTTESKKETVRRPVPDRLVLSLKQPAENNRANERLLEIVRSMYPGRSVKIIKGHHSPSKIIEVVEV
jgi:uncharacterized protein YggU (UPF0235/DUF167 family)